MYNSTLNTTKAAFIFAPLRGLYGTSLHRLVDADIG
jgi:hypothetical protein